MHGVDRAPYRRGSPPRGSRKDIGAYELTGWTPDGQGCPGTGNTIPVLGFSGNIGPGESVGIDLSSARASSQVALTLGGTCCCLNQSLILLFMTSSATGTASVPAIIPTTARIKGTTVYVQYGMADPAAAGGVAVTEGGTVRM